MLKAPLGGGGVTRVGSSNPEMAGPLSQQLILKLVDPAGGVNGLILDSWLDADGAPQGNAADS